jgi:hypothetical protein
MTRVFSGELKKHCHLGLWGKSPQDNRHTTRAEKHGEEQEIGVIYRTKAETENRGKAGGMEAHLSVVVATALGPILTEAARVENTVASFFLVVVLVLINAGGFKAAGGEESAVRHAL